MIRYLIPVIALIGWSWSVTALAAPPPNAEFKSTPCMFDLPFGATDGKTITCGYLTVPEHHQQPTGKTLELAVAILKTQSDTPAPDPIFMAQGGPGGSTIDAYASMMFYAPLDPDRDIVLFDQRGTLYSKPALLCPETLTMTLETVGLNLSAEESNYRSLQAAAACHSRLTQEGVNLAAFNSLENAADIEALRLALGYEQINFYGVSYGTLLGLHLMQAYPDSLRSVILDGVVPRQTNFITESPYSTDRAFSQLFQACLNSPSCQEAYPNLEKQFFNLVTRLNEKPAKIWLTDTETGQDYEAVLTGDQLIGVLFQMLYVTELIPMLPMFIDQLEHEDYSFLATIWPLFLFERKMSEGMYHSVICAEDADFGLQDVRLQGIRPQLQKDAELGFISLLKNCVNWQVPALGAGVDAPVVSVIPTLLLSGQFDPITPPAFAAEAAKTLTHSYNYTFPTQGHGAQGKLCANEIIRHFINHPEQTPDSSCLTQEPTYPAFFTPDTTLPLSFMPDLMINAPWSYGLVFIGLCLSGLGLGSVWLVWPFTTLISWLTNSTSPTSWPARLLRGLALLTSGLNGLFWGGLGVAFSYTLYTDSNMILVGLTAWSTPLFILPPLLVLLTIGLIMGCLMAWIMGYWSVWGRVYYTIVTLLAMGHVMGLAWWGFMTIGL